MQIKFVVTAEVERQQGKFATKDELADQIKDALESADPGSLEGENGGEYNVESWDVDQQEG